MLALRDYYRQQADNKRKLHVHGETALSRVADQDEWALEWININRLQAIIEAFDDDASGFITIAEVNQFTASRPKGWRYVTSSGTYCFSERILSGAVIVSPTGLRIGRLVGR